MSLQKKNVVHSFLREDYVPLKGQQIVKYLGGRGNNYHQVESPCGSTYLVSMPKKLGQTVWIKRGDCLVIDPISKGNKILGEILCILPLHSVIDLIHSGKWPSSPTADPSDSATLINFFKSESEKLAHGRSRSPTPLPSEEEGEGDVDSEGEGEEGRGQGKLNDKAETVEGFKSCVQFVTSGVVTVTNVIDVAGSLEPGIQSLDFETEESSAEESSAASPVPRTRNPKDFQRQANTIRIQVNYPHDKEHSLTSADFIDST